MRCGTRVSNAAHLVLLQKTFFYTSTLCMRRFPESLLEGLRPPAAPPHAQRPRRHARPAAAAAAGPRARPPRPRARAAWQPAPRRSPSCQAPNPRLLLVRQAPAARPGARRDACAPAPSRLQRPRPRPRARPRATLPRHLESRTGQPAAQQRAPLRHRPAPPRRLAWRARTGGLAPRRCPLRLLSRCLRLVWRARAGRLTVLLRHARQRRPRSRGGPAAGLRRRLPRGGRRPAAARPGSPRAPARRRREVGSQPGGAGRPLAACTAHLFKSF
jgi:hypothetical protein